LNLTSLFSRFRGKNQYSCCYPFFSNSKRYFDTPQEACLHEQFEEFIMVLSFHSKLFKSKQENLIKIRKNRNCFVINKRFLWQSFAINLKSIIGGKISSDSSQFSIEFHLFTFNYSIKNAQLHSTADITFIIQCVTTFKHCFVCFSSFHLILTPTHTHTCLFLNRQSVCAAAVVKRC
jgi:hypothetical protein